VDRSIRRPAFTNPDGSLKRFDLVTANPMWNQNFPAEAVRNDHNLGPGRYVAQSRQEDVLPLEKAVVLLRGTGGGRQGAMGSFRSLGPGRNRHGTESIGEEMAQ
jgi:hypothetical protein